MTMLVLNMIDPSLVLVHSDKIVDIKRIDLEDIQNELDYQEIEIDTLVVYDHLYLLNEAGGGYLRLSYMPIGDQAKTVCIEESNFFKAMQIAKIVGAQKLEIFSSSQYHNKILKDSESVVLDLASSGNFLVTHSRDKEIIFREEYDTITLLRECNWVKDYKKLVIAYNDLPKNIKNIGDIPKDIRYNFGYLDSIIVYNPIYSCEITEEDIEFVDKFSDAFIESLITPEMFTTVKCQVINDLEIKKTINLSYETPTHWKILLILLSVILGMVLGVAFVVHTNIKEALVTQKGIQIKLSEQRSAVESIQEINKLLELNSTVNAKEILSKFYKHVPKSAVRELELDLRNLELSAVLAILDENAAYEILQNLSKDFGIRPTGESEQSNINGFKVYLDYAGD